MARTAEAARRIRARKLDRRGLPVDDRSWMKFKNCELCGRPYCVNNYSDHKTRLRKWQGFIICAYCQFSGVKMINQLVKAGVLKYTKDHKRKMKG